MVKGQAPPAAFKSTKPKVKVADDKVIKKPSPKIAKQVASKKVVKAAAKISKYERPGVTWTKGIRGEGRAILAINQKLLTKPYTDEEQAFLDKRNRDRRMSRKGDRQAVQALHDTLTPAERQDAFDIAKVPTAEFPGRVARAALYAVEALREETQELKRLYARAMKEKAEAEARAQGEDDSASNGDGDSNMEDAVAEDGEAGKDGSDADDDSEEGVIENEE